MSKYEWKQVAEGRYHLLDAVSHRPVASIEQGEAGGWHWLRNTTVKLQGAPPAQGECSGLDEAMVAVVDGLPC